MNRYTVLITASNGATPAAITCIAASGFDAWGIAADLHPNAVRIEVLK